MSLEEDVKNAEIKIRQDEVLLHNEALIKNSQIYFEQNKQDFNELGYEAANSDFMLNIYLPRFHCYNTHK